MARDYSKGKVYMIRSKDKDCVPYVGSTTKQYLSQRIEKHHSNYKQWKKNGKGFMSSFTLFEKYGFNECYIELLERCPCKISEELLKKEREWFDKLNCVNLVKPFVTEEEIAERGRKYNEEHKEEIAEKRKIYYETNKEELSEKAKEYYDTHKEERGEYHKKWSESHKEDLAEYNKDYREKNREFLLQQAKDYKIKIADKRNEQMKERYVCDCGVESLLWNKARHNRSKKHQEYLSTVNTFCTTAVTESS